MEKITIRGVIDSMLFNTMTNNRDFGEHAVNLGVEAKKVGHAMVTIFWNSRGILLIDTLAKGQAVM